MRPISLHNDSQDQVGAPQAVSSGLVAALRSSMRQPADEAEGDRTPTRAIQPQLRESIIGTLQFDYASHLEAQQSFASSGSPKVKVRSNGGCFLIPQ